MSAWCCAKRCELDAFPCLSCCPSLISPFHPRKPIQPPGELLPKAHQVEREFALLSALHSAGFPVAKPLWLCEDSSVIGTAFYCMDFVEGRIFREPTLAGLAAAERTAIYNALIDVLRYVIRNFGQKQQGLIWLLTWTLAYPCRRLHEIDLRRLKLPADFYKSGTYFERQLHTWHKQYTLACFLGKHFPSLTQALLSASLLISASPPFDRQTDSRLLLTPIHTYLQHRPFPNSSS